MTITRSWLCRFTCVDDNCEAVDAVASRGMQTMFCCTLVPIFSYAMHRVSRKLYVCSQVLPFVTSDEVVEQVRPTLIHKDIRMNDQVALALGNNRIRRCMADMYVPSRIEYASNGHKKVSSQESTTNPTGRSQSTHQRTHYKPWIRHTSS